MSYEHKLRYAGPDPYGPELDTLPQSVLDELCQTEPYHWLAKVRWLGRELDEDLVGRDDVPQDVMTDVYQAVDGQQQSLSIAVNEFVMGWLLDHGDELVEERGVDPEDVDEAFAAYGLEDDR